MQHHSMTSLFRLLVIAVAVLGIRAAAFGQGASGEVPDPLGLRETGELFDRYVDLDDSDWLLIEAMHDDYLADFETLRDGPIAEFLAIGRELRASNTGMIPSLKQLEGFFDAWRSVVGRVHRLDEQFFASVAATVGEEAAEGVERARLVRQRQADAAAVMGGLSLRDTSLDDAFWSMTPTAEEVAAVDDVLRGLESSTPRLVRAVAVGTVESVLEVARRLDRAGYGGVTEADMNDGDRGREIMAAVSEAYAGAMSEIYDSRVNLMDREITAARLFRDRLEPARWRRMKHRWATGSFPEAYIEFEIGGDAPTVPEVAEGVRSLLPEESRDRVTLDEMLVAWYRSDDRLTDQMIVLGRDIMRVLFEQAGVQNGAQLEDELEAVARSRQALRAKATESLLALLPEASREAMMSDLAGREAAGDAERDGSRAGVVGGGVAVDDAGLEAGQGGSTFRIVNPVTADELEFMLDILALEAVDRDVARSLHADYLDAWAGEVPPILEVAAARTPYEDDDAFGKEALLRNGEYLAAVQATRRLDERLFGDFATAIGTSITPERLVAVRLQRIFDRAVDVEPLSATGRFATSAPEASPFEIIDGMDFDPTTRANAIAALLPEVPGLLEVYSGVDEDRIDAARQDILDSVAFDEKKIDYVDFTTSVNRRALRILGDRERRRTRIEAAMLEAVVPALESLSSIELEFEVADRGMYARGGDRTTGVVRRALRLPDLEPEQIDTLATILREHLERELDLLARARTFRLESSRLPEIVEIDGGVSTRYDGEQAVQQELGKLVFQRDELRERLRKRVLSTLSDEQRRRIDASR
ncbi:MAG: hypothetical protein CBB69_000290 [Phycisphaera sp. TMED9]|nr:MAG: hypothetical protein CBB69_000290 [Phycisphaera sp. TMED9]